MVVRWFPFVQIRQVIADSSRLWPFSKIWIPEPREPQPSPQYSATGQVLCGKDLGSTQPTSVPRHLFKMFCFSVAEGESISHSPAPASPVQHSVPTSSELCTSLAILVAGTTTVLRVGNCSNQFCDITRETVMLMTTLPFWMMRCLIFLVSLRLLVRRKESTG